MKEAESFWRRDALCTKRCTPRMRCHSAGVKSRSGPRASGVAALGSGSSSSSSSGAATFAVTTSGCDRRAPTRLGSLPPETLAHEHKRNSGKLSCGRTAKAAHT